MSRSCWVGGGRGCWFLYIFVCVSCVSNEVLLGGGWQCHITSLKTHSQTQIGVVGVGGWRGVGWFLYIFVCVSCVSNEVLGRGLAMSYHLIENTFTNTNRGCGGWRGRETHVWRQSCVHPGSSTPWHFTILHRNTSFYSEKY